MPSSINPYIQTILNAIYGRDVRQAIADGIQLCYDDAISGMPTQSVLGDADLNDYVDSGIWNLVTGHTYQNVPITTGLLMVVRISDAAIHQITFSRTKNIYMRSKYMGDDWTTWAPLLETPVTISVTGKHITSAYLMVAPYDDANTIPPNEILTYSNIFPANFPHSFKSGNNESCTVITFGRSKEATSLMLQILAHGSGTSRQSKIDLYYRLAFVNSPSEIVWRNWERINAPSVRMTPELFEKIAVLGDSYASGMTTDSTPRYHCSWLQMLCRQYGCVGQNYSKGSLTSRSWFTSDAGYPKFSADTELYNLYFVAFGINDSNSSQSYYVPLGTVDDIVTSNYPDTFYGNMAHIHDVIMEKNPNALICFITPMRIGGRYEAYADAVVDLSNHYGCLLIDSRNIPLFRLPWWDDKLDGNHPTVAQYSAIANAVADELSNALFNNMSYVNDFDPIELNNVDGDTLYV